MRRLLPLLAVPAVTLAAMAFAPTVGRAQIVGFEKADKVKEKDNKDKETDNKDKGKVPDDLFGKVDKVKDKGDKVEGVPFTPVATSNPEASSLAMMGVVVKAAMVVGLVRRARKVAE